MYTFAAGVACVALLVLWNIPLLHANNEPQPQPDGSPGNTTTTGSKRRGAPPVGARCCDKLLFGRTLVKSAAAAAAAGGEVSPPRKQSWVGLDRRSLLG